MEILIVSLASLMAGLVDAIVGGGGLILVPTLFATFPQAAPATLFGTNKSASIWGTAFASYQYSRKVKLNTASLWPAAIAGLAGSLVGAWTVTHIDPSFFRKVLPVLLSTLLLYTLVLLAGTLLPFIYGMSGWLYLASALILGILFLVYAFRLWRRYSDALARKTFRFSIIYLMLLFAALLVDHYWKI